MDLELMKKLLFAIERLADLDGMYSWEDEETALQEAIQQETIKAAEEPARK